MVHNISFFSNRDFCACVRIHHFVKRRVRRVVGNFKERESLRLRLGRVLSQDNSVALDVVEALLTEVIPVGNKANTSVI